MKNFSRLSLEDSNTVLHREQSLLMLVGILNVFTTTKWGYDQLNANITGHYTV